MCIISQHPVVIFVSQVEVAVTVYRDALRTGQASGTRGGGVIGEVGLAEDEIGDAAAQRI